MANQRQGRSPRSSTVAQRAGASAPPPVGRDLLCPQYTVSPAPATWGDVITLTAVVGTFGPQTANSHAYLLPLAKPTTRIPLNLSAWSLTEVSATLPPSSPDASVPANAWAIAVHCEGGLTDCPAIGIEVDAPIAPPGTGTVEPPVMLALLDHDHPNWLFLMVPSDSPLPAVVAGQGKSIGAGEGLGVGDALGGILGTLPTGGLGDALGVITRLLADPNARVIVFRGEVADDLHDFQFDSSFAHTMTAEDAMDGVVFIGPPGWSVVCSNDKDQKDGQGQFTLTTGQARFVRIDSLKSVQPSSDAAAGTVAINHSPDGVTFPQFGIHDFEDELSSVRFVRPS